MNPRQHKVLIYVGVAIVAMLLYPPYVIRNPSPGGSYVFESGFAFLLNLPHRATVDVTTLAVQWIAAAVVGGIAFVLAKR